MLNGSRLLTYFLPSCFDAAAALESAFFSEEVCLALGLQLPFSPAALPGVGSKPGQQVCSLDDFFEGVFFAEVFFAGVFFAAVFFAGVFFAVAMRA